MLEVAAHLRTAGCAFADDEALVLLESTRDPAELATMVERRCSGAPLEHVVGWAAFGGLRVTVTAGVFVPRRRTEFLAREAAKLLRPGAIVVDLCCGAGAIGLALLAAPLEGPPIELHSVDIDPVAVECASRNLGARAHVHEGDLDAPLPPSLRGRVDLVVANVPYVPTGEIALLPAEARDHEPRAALDGGLDGLDVARRAASSVAEILAPGGHFLVETSDRQAAAATLALARAGLVARTISDDDLGATVAVGVKRSA